MSKLIVIALLLNFILVACDNNEMTSVNQNFPTRSINDQFTYFQHEYHYEPLEVSGNLLSLVYDIPYFGACGVFPPLHIINQQFVTGGGDGGMSPGASWSPFQIDEGTYSQLLDLVLKTNPKKLTGKSRYIQVQYIEDNSFDSIHDWFKWIEATCDKHREKFLKNNMKNSGE